MFDIKALENNQVHNWNVSKYVSFLFFCFLKKFNISFKIKRDHEMHRKRIEDIVNSRKKKIKDPLLIEHIKHMHQAKEQSRRMIQTGLVIL